MNFSPFPLNDNMRELTRHGSALFPIQYYVDELSYFANHTIPLHWHPELEFWVANGGPVDVQVSISEASRCFQSYLHTPPVSYLLNYRIEQAKSLLQNSMETVGQIGISCGFQSSGYFSKAFRKQTGMTPNQYRKQHHYSKEDS